MTNDKSRMMFESEYKKLYPNADFKRHNDIKDMYFWSEEGNAYNLWKLSRKITRQEERAAILNILEESAGCMEFALNKIRSLQPTNKGEVEYGM